MGSKAGFALIVTLTLMVLLLVLAVGLLSISTVSLRSESHNKPMAEARQNALLAMQLAIGQLQSLSGHDTRVTASAQLSDVANPAVTGVWRSWEGTDHDSTGRPLIPEYDSKDSAGNPTDTVAATGEGRFLGWLTSSVEGLAPDAGTVDGVSTTPLDDYVALVSDGISSTSDDRKIFVKPTLVNDNSGAIAWWTSGENSKAMINTPLTEEPTDVVGWQERVRGNGRADAEYFELADVDALGVDKVIPSTSSLSLVNAGAEIRRIHDLTTYSRGLLTNTATGGWRKDLSLLSESFDDLPESGFSLFNLAPGDPQTTSKARVNTHADNPLLYPWGEYRGNPNNQAFQQVGPVCSWSAVVDFMKQYEDLSSSSASKTVMPIAYGTWADGVTPPGTDRLNYVDRVRRLPQFAKVQWIYSMIASEPDTTGKHRVGLMVTPVMTLWNPYNVELTIPRIYISFRISAPLSFRFKVADEPAFTTKLSDVFGNSNNSAVRLQINSPVTLAPGASQVFGVESSTPIESTSNTRTDVVLVPGYRAQSGVVRYKIRKDGSSDTEVFADSADTFSIEEVTYGDLFESGGRSGFGVYFETLVNTERTGPHRMYFDEEELGSLETVLDDIYPPLTGSVSVQVDSILGNDARPFATANFGFRGVASIPEDGAFEHTITRGMLLAHPLTYHTEAGFADASNAVDSMKGSGTYHPINSAYEITFQELDGWDDSNAQPQVESSTNSSYIFTGSKPFNGLTRAVIAELPTRPLQSLAQLQHFDARNNNVHPPYQFNLIGNGSAHPIFPADEVYVETDFDNGMINDDVYMLNHVLFDDCFVSSIAPDLRDFSSSEERSIEKVYEDHISQETRLPNRFYLPTTEASGKNTTAEIAETLSGTLDSDTNLYPYETIASLLEVEGMFNINSVSVDAWKSLLRQGRNLEVPYLDADGATQAGSAGSDDTYGFSRTSIAGDQATDSGSGLSNSSFSDAVEFAGHRVFTDEQIDALAEEIVDQVRERGPFLSLSEFVNRKLTSESSERELALAGTIQSALDNLARRGSSSENPYSVMQENSTEITAKPLGEPDWAFPEAGLGWSSFGFPGWTRQADILTPIAPLISARDDTFKIRTYGDSRDSSGNIVARAWCEVVVQRNAGFVDPADPAALSTQSPLMTSEMNKRYGRRYEVVSFRWMSEDEIVDPDSEI